MRIILIFLVIFGQIFGAISYAKSQCPRECICEVAPLWAAPFVLTWMTSWGEDDLPELNPNEVLDVGLMASSGTAADAEVDVDAIGLHATCSLHPSTNLTSLLSSIPMEIMVLSILQAPGCNFTILDGGQLANFKSLNALHLQGYAHVERKQVSGFSPNSVSEFIAHKKLLEDEIKEKGENMRDLRFALAEDALQVLELQLLDLQYVRLVASREDRRSRRYSKEPISTTTLVDMPLTQFLRFADRIESFHLPPHLQYLYEDHLLQDDNSIDNHIRPTLTKFKLQKRLYVTDNGDIVVGSMNDRSKLMEQEKELESNKIEIVPYEVYKAETQPQLAPFKRLKRLKYLRVAHAKLDKMGAELLDGLHQLHTLTLENNRIKIIPQAIFAPTPMLRHLSLAYNNILLLEAGSLEGLSRLLTLDLDNNQISMIGPASFSSLPSLSTLRLGGNPISHLLPDAFASINSTKSIILGSLSISMDIHENSFRFLYHLNDLVLQNVSIETLKKSILSGMPEVQNLEIHGDVPEIDYDAFSATPNLKSLNLSNCHLKLLSIDAYYGLKYLVKLDLSHNELIALSPGIFDHLVSLKELYLHHNLLSTLPLGIFLPIPAKLIQLFNNPWHCSCDLLQLKPSITNKVRRGSHISCRWDEKLSTVCSKTEERLVYDARVAPLCHEPKELEGNDVYHAALRHLKCEKYHWDPRLLQMNQLNHEILRTTTAINTEVPKEKLNWLPLAVFTPVPIKSEDLFEVAEREGLEEVLEHTSSRSTVVNVLKPKTNIPQNDQPRLLKHFIEKHIRTRAERKRKMKSLIKARMLERKEKKKLHMEMLRNQERKMLIKKALIAAKDKRRIQRKQYKTKKIHDKIELHRANILKRN